jgi:hypothetical protein
MQIDYVKISYKEDVHICCTNFAKKMEQNSHKTTSQWKTYGKQLFSEDLEVQDVALFLLFHVELFHTLVLRNDLTPKWASEMGKWKLIIPSQVWLQYLFYLILLSNWCRCHICHVSWVWNWCCCEAIRFLKDGCNMIVRWTNR